MVRASYTKKIVKIEHIWFHQPIKEDTHKGMDIIYYHGVKDAGDNNSSSVRITKQYSWLTDLTQSKDDIFAGIRKNYRYEIRRVGKENVKMKTISADEMKDSPEILDAFAETYNQMYQDKGMDTFFNRKLVESYIAVNGIIFTIAYLNDEPLVFHSYIIDDNNVRFFYSTSPFREQKDLANEIARMNKALHWHDICYFKDIAIQNYDWGGILLPNNPNGIDQFKMGFTGQLVEYNNIIKATSLLGKAVLIALAAKDIFKKHAAD